MDLTHSQTHQSFPGRIEQTWSEARPKALDEFYKEHSTKNEECKIYLFAKNRERKTRNFNQDVLRIKKGKF